MEQCLCYSFLLLLYLVVVWRSPCVYASYLLVTGLSLCLFNKQQCPNVLHRVNVHLLLDASKAWNQSLWFGLRMSIFLQTIKVTLGGKLKVCMTDSLRTPNTAVHPVPGHIATPRAGEASWAGSLPLNITRPGQFFVRLRTKAEQRLY